MGKPESETGKNDQIVSPSVERVKRGIAQAVNNSSRVSNIR
jgi:hypothetical protein